MPRVLFISDKSTIENSIADIKVIADIPRVGDIIPLFHSPFSITRNVIWLPELMYPEIINALVKEGKKTIPSYRIDVIVILSEPKNRDELYSIEYVYDSASIQETKGW